MTEFDFDELDKAVNDLMSGVDTSKPNPSLDDPEDTVVVLDAPSSSSGVSTDVAPVAAPTAAPAVSQPQVAPAPADAAATPSLATKRRGQFMDVIHPSSDMKSTAKPVSRQAQTVQPTEEVQLDSGSPAPAEDSPNPETVSFDMESTGGNDAAVTPEAIGETQSSAAAQDAGVSQWPDPIDLAEQQSSELAPEPTSEMPEHVSSEEAPAVSTNEPVAPLTSPFLPDAKVEKRPLGEPVSVVPAEQISSDESIEQKQDEVDEPITPRAEESVPVVELPDELKSDIVALESSTTTVAEATVPAVSSDPEVSSDSSPEPQVPAGGSILQQYTEQPSTGDQTNGAIFDTKEYHQPVEAGKPAKKSSPLKLILWIIGLLVLGAISGAAYFYFTR